MDGLLKAPNLFKIQTVSHSASMHDVYIRRQGGPVRLTGEAGVKRRNPPVSR